MIIVESDQIAQGKRIKAGSIIIVGTKPTGELKSYEATMELFLV